MKSSCVLVLAAATLLLVGACGGGGGDGGEEPQPQQFTVGGTAAGIQRGELVLQLNGASDLTIADDGDFTFSDPISEGASYEVTVLSPPRGQRCEVSDSSGNAAANVTNVSVSCASDPSAFYSVFTATTSTNDPEAGLYAFYSRSLGSEPVRVTQSSLEDLGYSMRFALDGAGRVSPGNPHAFFYATADTSGGNHVWALDLTGASELVPRQLSNLTLEGESNAVCERTVAYEDLGKVCTSGQRCRLEVI